jgi:hypothetical protein
MDKLAARSTRVVIAVIVLGAVFSCAHQAWFKMKTFTPLFGRG